MAATCCLFLVPMNCLSVLSFLSFPLTKVAVFSRLSDYVLRLKSKIFGLLAIVIASFGWDLDGTGRLRLVCSPEFLLFTRSVAGALSYVVAAVLTLPS